MWFRRCGRRTRCPWARVSEEVEGAWWPILRENRCPLCGGLAWRFGASNYYVCARCGAEFRGWEE
ncbi:MAG: hypothetical protein DRJ56_08790 [Thermoprotei archaeon]|nr:MAG: hypothetical protein DRJ56_08790 [Thermoprotei archaeon]